jgi:hypothetical protein
MYEHESEIITLLTALLGIGLMSLFLKGVAWFSNSMVENSNNKINNEKVQNYLKLANAYRLPDHNRELFLNNVGGSEKFYVQTIQWTTAVESNFRLFSKSWMGSPVAVLKTGKLVDDEMITPHLYPWLQPFLDNTKCLTPALNDMHINPLDTAELDGGGVFFTVFPSSFPAYVQYRSSQTVPRRSVELDGSNKLFLATRLEAIDFLTKLGKSIAQNSFNSPNKSKEFIVRRRGIREIPTPELLMEVISMDAPSPTLSGSKKLEVNLNIESVHKQIVNKLDELLGDEWPSIFTVGHFILSQTPNYKYSIRAFSQWNRTCYNVHKYWMCDTDPFLMTTVDLESMIQDTEAFKIQNRNM